MTHKTLNASSRWALLSCVLAAAASAGCQSTIGGQTLPSPYYLQDDVQYFPAGPEFKLSRQVEELNKYNLQRQGLESGVETP